MKIVSIALIFILLVLATAGSAISEEMAKQGSMAVTSNHHCPVTYMPMGKNLQITFEALGPGVTDTEQDIFHNFHPFAVNRLLPTEYARTYSVGLFRLAFLL